jgi:hypothetical protein
VRRGSAPRRRRAARRDRVRGHEMTALREDRHCPTCGRLLGCHHAASATRMSAPATFHTTSKRPTHQSGSSARMSSTPSVWTRRATTARSPKRSFLGPAERKHRRAGSSEQQILLLARGEAGASTRDRDAIGSRFEQKAARTRSRLRLLPVVAHARDRALADRASVSALIDRCCFHRRSGVVDPAALARIAARAGSDSRLQPVKHEPHGSGATLSLAFRTRSLTRPRAPS